MATATESGFKLVPDCKLLGWGKMRLFQRKGGAIAELGRGAGDLKCGSEKWPGLLGGDWAVGGHEQRGPSAVVIHVGEGWAD